MRIKCLFVSLVTCIILLSVSGFDCGQVTPSPSASATMAMPQGSPSLVVSPTCATWPSPTWHGITPGQTSKQEVLRILSEPNTIKTWDNLESMHYFMYNIFTDTFYRVVIQDGVVDMLYVESEDGDQEKAQIECMRCYNDGPENESVHQEGSISVTIELYPRCGIAFVREGPKTIGTQYFVPMTLEEYRSRWGRYFPEDDPVSHPFPGLPNVAGVVAGRTTRNQIIQLYGQPDYSETTAVFGFPPRYDRATGGLEIAYYRVPGTIERTHFFLFAFHDDVVQMTIINREIGDSPQYNLADVITEFGVPEIVYERPKDRPDLPVTILGPTFRKLCYPTRGFTIEAIGDDKPSQADEVQFAYYYIPMSVEDYKNSWDGYPGPSTPIEWKGFVDSQ